MKLRSQILAIGLAGAAVAALVGAVGLFSVDRLSDAFDGAIRMGVAVQSSQRAAMMHGAVRGDVQRAMLGSIGRDKAQIAEAQAALESHVKSLDSALHTLEGLPLPTETTEQIGKTLPLVKSYTDSATELLRLTAGDSPVAAAVAIPGFQKLYGNVESAMGVQVEAIARVEHAFTEQSKLVVAEAKLLVIGSLVVATALLLIAALALARHMSKPMAHAVEVAGTVAHGDLSVTVRPEGNDETVKLLEAVSEMQSSLGAIVKSVQNNAGRVAAASAEIAQGNDDLSARTERQASSLQQTASSMEELSVTVKRNADSAAQANRLASMASEMAAKGDGVVAQVVETMQAIQQSTAKIGDIVTMVQGLAAQTNILAINAAVEAARAGESGRGFAVVATEVRSLASRSSEAAKAIAALVNTSVGHVDQGSALVAQARAAIADVAARIKHVTTIMGEISLASSEQSAGVSQVERAVADMDETTQRNAALVEQMAAAAGTLKDQANDLVQTVSVFKLA